MFNLKPYNYDLLDAVYMVTEESKIVDWNQVFNNDNPLIVEIGCGNGHYLTNQANKFTLINFIGIEMKKNRVVRCRQKEVRDNLNNIRWINSEAFLAIDKLFSDKTIDRFYMLFPDPWPKRRHHKKRLFNDKFLDLIFKKMKNDADFIFLTDHEGYFKWCNDFIVKDERFEINLLPLDEEMTESVFGEKWKNENRNFYNFTLKKK